MCQGDRLWDWQTILENGNFKKTDKVLEVGALFGEFAIQLSPLVARIFVTDSYGWAERKFVRADGRNLVKEWEDHIATKDNLHIEVVDMQNIPYKDNSFDKVVCISAIEHVPKDRKALEEMMRVLGPKGLLLLTTEYHPTMSKIITDEDGAFYRVYNLFTINELTKGFNVIKKEMATEYPEDYTTIFMVIEK